jgi:hypothetical protein
MAQGKVKVKFKLVASDGFIGKQNLKSQAPNYK